MDVSIIIPAYNAEKSIHTLLDSLATQITQCSYEVIVVDHESSDGTRQCVNSRIASYPVPLSLSSQPRSVFIAKVRNHGVDLASGEVLAFIDSDCEASSNWVQDGYTRLSEVPDGALLAGGCIHPPDPTWFQRAWNTTRDGHKVGGNFVHGANLFIGKGVFQDLGGFNESLETSEDFDLGRRVSQKYSIIHAPEFVVIHHGDTDSLKRKLFKEFWYGKNSFDMLKGNLLYKPFWGSLIFVFTGLILILAIIFMKFAAAFISFVAMVMLSFLVSFYFCRRSGNYSALLPLIPICFVYLLGRGVGIIYALFEKLLFKLNR